MSLPALRVVSASSRGGPSAIAVEPVALQMLEWVAPEAVPDAQELIARLGEITPRLAPTPPVAAGTTPLHTFGMAVSTLARYLLDPRRTVVDLTFCAPPKDRRVITGVGAFDAALSHKALTLAAALLLAVRDGSDRAAWPALRTAVDELDAQAARIHPDDDERVLLAGARKLGLPVLAHTGSGRLQVGWGMNGRLLADLAPGIAAATPPAPDSDPSLHGLLVIDGRLAAATHLRATGPRDVLRRVHTQVRAQAQAYASREPGRVIGLLYRTPDITQPGPADAFTVDPAPGLAVHAVGGLDPAELAGPLMAGEASRIPLVIAVAAPEILGELAQAWQEHGLSAGHEGRGIAMAQQGSLDGETVASQASLLHNTRALLSHRACTSLLIAATPKMLFEEGIPVDRCDAAVLVGTPGEPEAVQRLLQVLKGRQVTRRVGRAPHVRGAVGAVAAGMETRHEAPAVHRAAPSLPEDLSYLRRHALTDGPALFTLVRNEVFLLPHFLAHYRRLGVQNFLVWDDNSTDGSRELLLAQPDCSVLASTRKFNDTMPDGRAFHQWIKEAVPESLGAGRWVLGVDADEFLVLPAVFGDDLAGFQRELDRLGHDCIFGTMVDTHPATLGERNYAPTLSPFDGAPYFDVERGFRRRREGAPEKVLSGVRARLIEKLRRHHPDVHRQVFGGQGYLMPALFKVPFVRTGCGISRLNSHTVNRQPPQGIEVALAHFKFGPDLDGKIHDALAGQQHYLGSIEYRFLDAAVRLLADEDLRYEGTRSLADPGALEAAGLVQFEP